MRELSRDLTELSVELILLMMQTVGLELRRDDPTALKEIVMLVQTNARTLAGASKGASGTAAAPVSRIRFMLDALNDVKNNKRREGAGKTTELIQPLKNWLKSLTKTKATKKAEAHQMSLGWEVDRKSVV